jgi:serine/threonine protein kinase
MSSGVKDTNYYINSLEKSISEKHITHYQYSDFQDLQQVGRGSYADVFRATQKNTNRFVALKSFNPNKITLKEVIDEVYINILK